MTNPNDVQIGGDHYKNPGKEEHWDFTWRNSYNQFEYCITKYVARHFKKNGIQDLEKANHHLDKYISLVGKYYVIPVLRSIVDARKWCEDLDYQQSAIIEHVHVGRLDEASMSLIKYIKQLKYLETNPPREYVTGGD